MYKDYANILADFIFDSIFNRNVLHGDLHPGNILLLKEKDEKGDAIFKIGLIDFGIICHFDELEKTKLLIFLKYAFSKNFDDLFKYMVSNLLKKINPNVNSIRNEKIIVDELLVAQKKYNLLQNFIKDRDLFIINSILKKNGYVLKDEMNSLLVYLCCMYSLLYILLTTNPGLFEKRFASFIEKKSNPLSNNIILEKIKNNKRIKDSLKILQEK
jgi:hypothetical protein